MSGLHRNRSKDVVATFLSCSVRSQDWPLVDELQKLLEARGFHCFTIGRNVSLPEQPDDAIRRVLSSCECLVGVATERLSATDRDFPARTLSLATPYLLQETSMAYQADLPFLIFKAKELSLVGITNRNLWIEIDGRLSAKGKVKFNVTQDALLSSLNDLKTQALARRAHLKKAQWKEAVGRLSSLALGGVAVAKAIDLVFRPPCFGDFYYKGVECKRCDYRERCKVEKLKASLGH